MTDLRAWQASNDRQLEAALAALRQRLEQFIRQSSPQQPEAPAERPAAAAPPARTVRRSLIERLLRGPAPIAATVVVSPPAIPEEAAVPEPRSALDQLAEGLRMSAFEKNLLLLCAAMELDTRVAGLCAQAQGDPQRGYPTFALALALFDEPSWEALSPERPLRYWHLIELNPGAARPLTSSPIRADERIVNYLKGLNYLDDRLSAFVGPLELEAGPAEIAASQAEVVQTIHGWLNQPGGTGKIPLVQLVGPDAISKQLVAFNAAAQYGRQVYRLAAGLLPTVPSELELLARLWQRESQLLPLALFLDAEELEASASERMGALSRFLTRSEGLFFIGVAEAVARLGRAGVAVDVARPTVVEQEAAWTSALGAGAAEIAAQLAAQFNLNLPAIRKLAGLARTDADGTTASLQEKAWTACCASECRRLDALAHRLEPKMTWDDLVLPAAELGLLRQVTGQVGQRQKVYSQWGFARKMTRGLGISALFSGASGTGKTMAAEVIANALRLSLYRIDLSAVVSKYIGETEKNLRRLFDAAEDGGAILFFDEADALFGRRSDVKDSHDRYANIEINYLLQRMEDFRGLAILSTNMKSALDNAFLRRLRFIVNFPFPGPTERESIWRKVFPAETPTKDLDFGRLARLNLSGGSIQNIALNAAFAAAQSGGEVTMELVLGAARDEFNKLDRTANEAEFRWRAPVKPGAKPAVRNGAAVLA